MCSTLFYLCLSLLLKDLDLSKISISCIMVFIDIIPLFFFLMDLLVDNDVSLTNCI